MSTLEEEYKSIVAQLDAFIGSADLASAIRCISSRNLEEKIKEIDPHWEGLRENPKVTLERLKRVVTTIRQGIFCGEGHIFYIRVVCNNKASGADGEYLYPRRSDKTFQYAVKDKDVYFIDIKDLSGGLRTPNLYTYESDDTLATGYPNPFNLTDPRVREEKDANGKSLPKYLPYGVRMYGVCVDQDDPQHVLTLKNATNGIVLTLQFDYTLHTVVDARMTVTNLLNALLETCL